MQVVNHGVEERVLSGMMEETKAFFDLPWEEKAAYASDGAKSPVKFGTSLNSPCAHVRNSRDYVQHVARSFHMWPHPPPINYE